MKFGEIIRVFRKNNKMTMQEFADKAGLSKGYISMLEKNQHPQSQRRLVPSFETYLKVASAMNMSIDELVALLDDNETVRLNESSSSAPELELTEQEERLLVIFRRLNRSQQERLIAYAEGMLDAKEDAGSSEYRPISPIPEKQKAVEDAYKKVLGNMGIKEVKHDDI